MLLRHVDGRLEQSFVPWLVGCDGGAVLVRKQLGLTFEGSLNPEDWVLADLHLGELPENEFHVAWHIRPGRLPCSNCPAGYGELSPTCHRSATAGTEGPAANAGGLPEDRSRPRSGGCRSAGCHLDQHVSHRRVWDIRLRAGDRSWPGEGRTHPQPGRRPGNQHRHAGRRKPGLEARRRLPAAKCPTRCSTRMPRNECRSSKR